MEKVEKEKNNVEKKNKSLNEKKEVKENKIENFKEKYLESLAEMENLRKRLEKEKIDFIKYRASSFIYDILPTLDMFEDALSSKNVSKEIKNWLVGFEMILNNFKKVLNSEGVTEIIVKKGDEFDGKLHQSIEEKKTDEVDHGKILEVKIKGYKIYDRLLRPAAVVLAAKKGE